MCHTDIVAVMLDKSISKSSNRSMFSLGWPVTHRPAVPVHRLAGTGGSKAGRGVHRFYWTSPQDKGTVWSGWSNYCSL